MIMSHFQAFFKKYNTQANQTAIYCWNPISDYLYHQTIYPANLNILPNAFKKF
jgi:hypothetical protein